jgi:predicted component of viral defense system (DUF524 family)
VTGEWTATEIEFVAAVLERYLEFHRTLRVHFDSPSLDAPLDNLPKVYQQWCTLHVVKALLEVGSAHGFAAAQQALVHRDPHADVSLRILPGDKALLVLRHAASNTVLSVYSEHSFGSSGEIRSISFTQRPDIVLSLVRPDSPPLLAILDPKYKLDSELLGDATEDITGRPKKVDVDKMHAYRDAIRAPGDRRVVAFAATLYPGQTVEYSDGLAAIQAVPGELPDVGRLLERFVLRATGSAATSAAMQPQ